MKRVIDLTHLLEEGMITFTAPWHPVLEVTIMGRHSLEGRETRKVTIGTHTGTHVDAAAHFIPGGSTIEKTPVEVLVGPAHLVEFPNSEPLRSVSVTDVEKQLKGCGKVERLVFRFDWSRHWNTMQFYTDWPYLSEGLCHWIVKKKIKLIGMDTPSPDNPHHDRKSGNDSPNHKILLGAGVTMVEYMTNLSKIRARKFDLIALPLKLKDGDGAPARVIGIVED